ncbi:MAG: isochorismatase family protein [Alicyclobacillus herbarius]|uniref:isochorismatase family protein n=1 Tax=Alicyclobacillus herbarius TaxID=122960 RepID=UPI002352EE5E|nr:isochorismatase family protein [Alicyclobacillus herbarius]MCL6633663.1 isochorismatase family protein [Alicyclobacillus herbarius]
MVQRLLNISQAAKLLGVSSSTLRRLERNGVVEGYGLKVIYTPGGQRRYLLDEIQQLFTREGFSGRLGFGSRPVLLLRDLVIAFMDPNSRLAIQVENQIQVCRELIEVCLTKGISVVFSRTVFNPNNQASRMWAQKFSSLTVLDDPRWTEIHPDLSSYPYSLIIDTPYVTDFYNSPLDDFLSKQGVDTVILAGVTTSGSIRANAVDAIQRGFRVIIPQEAVGDRNQSLQATTLLDLNARYADVMDVTQVIEHLKVLKTNPRVGEADDGVK